jgi:hypothetical protein
MLNKMLIMTFIVQVAGKQRGAVEARGAHNPEAVRSKRTAAIYIFSRINFNPQHCISFCFLSCFQMTFIARMRIHAQFNASNVLGRISFLRRYSVEASETSKQPAEQIKPLGAESKSKNNESISQEKMDELKVSDFR